MGRLFSASFRHGEPINTEETDCVRTQSSSRKPSAHTHTCTHTHTHTLSNMYARAHTVSNQTGYQTRLPSTTFKIKHGIQNRANKVQTLISHNILVCNYTLPTAILNNCSTPFYTIPHSISDTSDASTHVGYVNVTTIINSAILSGIF